MTTANMQTRAALWFWGILPALALGFHRGAPAQDRPPTGLSCTQVADRHVELTWVNRGAYDSLSLFRDGKEIQPKLPGSQESFQDGFEDLSGAANQMCGPHLYQLYAKKNDAIVPGGTGGEPSYASCLVTVLCAPEGLTCAVLAEDDLPPVVRLDWQNPQTYDELIVRRDGIRVAFLTPDSTFFVDENLADGTYTYQVEAKVPHKAMGPSCTVTLSEVSVGNPVPVPTSLSVDLGSVDTSRGLVNLRNATEDGMNEPGLCGPQEDLREARRNLGAVDQQPQAGDAPAAATHGFFYFRTVDEVGPKDSLMVNCTLFDDPGESGTEVFLQHVQQGTADFVDSQTFRLEGGGRWVALFWKLSRPDFRRLQVYGSDFRIGVNNGRRVCIDQVCVLVDPPEDPVFHRGDANDDGQVNLSDVITKLNFLFGGKDPPNCQDAVDFDDNGVLGVSGAVYMLQWLFQGTGNPPPLPGPSSDLCGPDPTPGDNFENQDCKYTSC